MRNETPTSKHGPHISIVELSPVMVDSVAWGGQEHAKIGRSRSAVASPFDIQVMPVGKKWHREGFWRRWLRGGHHAAVGFWRQ